MTGVHLTKEPKMRPLIAKELVRQCRPPWALHHNLVIHFHKLRYPIRVRGGLQTIRPREKFCQRCIQLFQLLCAAVIQVNVISKSKIVSLCAIYLDAMNVLWTIVRKKRKKKSRPVFSDPSNTVKLDLERHFTRIRSGMILAWEFERGRRQNRIDDG